MTTEQYNAMTIEQKAAMFDEIQDKFINWDDKPFTEDDVEAFFRMTFAFKCATEYNSPSMFIQTLTQHLTYLHFEKTKNDKVLDFEDTASLIDMFSCFADAEDPLARRLRN